MFAHTEELPLRGWTTRPSWHSPSLSSSVLAVLLAASTLTGVRAWQLAEGAGVESAASASARPGIITSFGNRPTHNRRYHAELVSTPAPVVGAQQRWTMRLTRHDQRPLAGAHISAELWMPESGERSPVRPSVSYVGRGRYAIDGVYLSQPGWWNLALVIEGGAGTDSVAFNTVIP